MAGTSAPFIRRWRRVAAPVADTPVRLAHTPRGIRHRAPAPGEHDDRILAELENETEQIRNLREMRII